MPRSAFQRLLRVIGISVVVVILGLLVLPAVVVTLAAFNDKATPAVPPEQWSWRWIVKAIGYEDCRAGFRNGAIATLWASSTALVIGAAFALAIDRYEFRSKRLIET